MNESSYLKNIDAIIFDLDGVLLDTETAYTLATREILGSRAPEFTWQLKQKMMGHAPHKAADILIKALALPISADEFVAQLEVQLIPRFRKAQGTPGAAKMVALALTLPKGPAIATSSTRAMFNQKLTNAVFLQRIEFVVCVDDPQVVLPKPAPDIFLEAALQVKAKPERCLVFEDSPAGIIAARQAGIGRIIGLQHPELAGDPLPQCDLVVESFLELLAQ